ncbi:MAG: hypothetical protein RSE56_00855 [Bacilli bacterium]
MQPIFYVIIAFLVIFILLNIFNLVFSKINFNSISKEKYSFRRNFSYEITDNDGKYSYLLRYTYVIAAIFPIVILFIVLFSGINEELMFVYLLVATLFLVANGVCKAILFFLKTAVIKTYLYVYCAQLISLFSAINIFLLGLAMTMIKFYSFDTAIYLTFLILTIVLDLAIFIIIFNPKTYKWFILEKNEKDEYVRPKFFVLAFDEWLMIFTSIMFAIILISFIFCLLL